MPDLDAVQKFYDAWDSPAKAIRVIRKHPELAKNTEVLFDAAERWPAKVLCESIKQGADVNLVEQISGSVYYTPIRMAISAFKVENVKLLLSEGADPFVGDAIMLLVHDGIQQKTPARLKILQAIIDAGIDINAELQPIISDTGYSRRYNLYAHAASCLDEEILKMLDENGGKTLDLETGVIAPPPLNLKTLQKRLVRALKKGWSEVKRERKAKGESFYVFGLVTDSDCQTVIPVCNTHELADQEFGDLLKKYPTHKYHLPSIKDLFNAGGEYLDALNLEISGRDFRRYGMRKLLKIFEEALAELDEKKFFGSGRNRDKILLMIGFSDPDDQEEKLEQRIIRKLNPTEASKPYFELLKKIR